MGSETGSVLATFYFEAIQSPPRQVWRNYESEVSVTFSFIERIGGRMAKTRFAWALTLLLP